MNGDTGDATSTLPGTTTTTATTTPVRRSARTRKPNSRFADDEVDSCFKKIVSGLASPECTSAPSPGRPRKATARRKDSRSEEAEDRSDRGRKDAKEDEEVEERGRKLSEDCEEKSERKRKERSEEVEERGDRSEVGKKASQNEERSEEDSDERGERRKEDVEEKREKRRRKDSQGDESVERKDKPSLADKSPSHALPNGLEGGREAGEECTRMTRSGRPAEDSRRKTRKRGKGKEEQEEQEPVEPISETSPLELTNQDFKMTDREDCVRGAAHTTPDPLPACDGEEAVERLGQAEKGEDSEKDVALSHTPTEILHPAGKPQQEVTSQDGVGSSISSSSSSSPKSTVITNGSVNTTSSSTSLDITTTTTTTATSATPTTTAVTTITTTITAIAIPTTITTHSPQPPTPPVEVPTDPRLQKGTRPSPVGLLGGQGGSQIHGGINTSTSPALSIPPLPTDTGKEGEGSRGSPQGSISQEMKKILCENIPLPPDLYASPKHSKVEEPRRAGGKRDRSDKEEGTSEPQKVEEKEEEVPSSPASKRRKEMDMGRKDKTEESKEEETKRKRLMDAKEEDKRKRRKVEEMEEKEENAPEIHKETPASLPCTDTVRPPAPVPVPVPPPEQAPVPPPAPPPTPAPAIASVPATAPPLPPLPRKPPGSTPQNLPKARRESRDSRDSLSSPRHDRESLKEKDSPKRNRESLRNKITTLDVPRDTKDLRGGKESYRDSVNSFKCDTNSGKSEETAKEGCQKGCEGDKRVLAESGRNTRVREECAKSEKGAVKCEREPVKGRDGGKSDREALKIKDDLPKSLKSERDTVKSEKDKNGKGEKEASKSERSTAKGNKSEKDTARNREESNKSNRSERDTRSKDEGSKGGRGEREGSKTEKDAIKTEKETGEKNQEEIQGDEHTLPSLFPTQESDITGTGMGVFLGLSTTSTTAIPFLEDTPVSGASEEIPGLSILAASDSPRPRLPPKKEQSHRSWFTIGSGRRNQAERMEEEKKEEKEEKDILPLEKEEVEISVKEEEEKKPTEEDEAQKRKEAEERDARNRAVVDERLKSFMPLQENVYIGERKRTKRNKEVRRMVCDCSLTKEEMERGEVGCGDDCLNRLLMIECGSRCPLGDHCINKRFLNRQYGDVEVFNAEEKGCGLRARSDMPPGTFIMEYVGEVFDTREFKRRRKEYARDMRDHFYFMALKSDQLIDATRMGNISRFINHSCDPNAETQKWTVNGDLRIGFFSKRFIAAGEEINFDYRLERYGREPQRCYCGASICRGWLGEAPDEQTKEEKDEARRKEEKDRRKREERRAFFEDIDLEEEIEKLNSHKLRNRQDTLNLSRLMVRAEDFTSRVLLLQLLQTGEPACRRLFLDYHGLKVLWSWMADLGLSQQHTMLKLEILQTLEVLPITNKTQLTDSRVLSLVERWSSQAGYTPSSTSSCSLSPPPPPPPKADEPSLPPPTVSLATETDPNKKSSDTSEESDSETDPKLAIEASSADDSSMDSEVDNPKASVEEESSDSNDAKDAAAATTTTEDKLRVERLSDEEKEAQELLELHKTMVALAKKLLDAWKNLKEFFRIPKKERIEMMKEHEREVDRGYKEYLDQASESDRDSERRDKDRDRYNRRDHHYDRRRRSPDRDKERYSRGRGISREDRSSDSPRMSKEQRRQLFELKVQQQEEEAKQRKMQEEMWTMHVDRCRLLGHDPYLTPIFDPTYQYFWDPVAANWQPYTGSDPNLPVPAGYGLTKGEGEGSPLTLMVPGGRSHLPGGRDPPGLGQGGPNDPLNPANIPLPGEVPALATGSPSQGQEGTPPHGTKLLSIPLPGEVADGEGAVVEGSDTPGAITVHLPPRWRLARDATGHVYFYHVKTRVSQWEPPAMLNSALGSDSSSESSSDSDSDSSSTTDSEDFSSEEEEEEEEEAVAVTTEVSDEKMIRRPKGTKRRRSEALVQERVISPIMEVDKEAARRERREAKERAREEARQERQEERNTRGQKEDQSQSQPQQQQQQQQQQQTEGVEGVAAVTAAASAPVERDRERDRERERRSERHEARAKREKSKERAATAIADNSDAARKIKDAFRSKMATFIVSVLNPYRRGDCREGKITCTEDFKYLARKLTHFVMVKELKQLHSIEALECSDSVKHKTRDFVRKYMSKYGSVFKRDPNDTKEY